MDPSTMDRGRTATSPNGKILFLETVVEDAQIQTPYELPKASSMKYVSLVLLVLQNAVVVLLMRYSRVRDVTTMYLPTTTVAMAEAMKLIACSCVIFIQERGNPCRFVSHINENIIQKPWDCVKIAIPSIIYMFQNNVLFVAISNLDAVIFQVSYQMRVLVTALFSVLLLNKQVTRIQWGSLFLIFIGVAMVQLHPSHTNDVTKDNNHNTGVGMAAVLAYSLMSGFASVYLEKVLKTTTQSLWIRNIQLGFFGVIGASLTAYINDGPILIEHGFFQGYDTVVWGVVVLNSLGGLIIAFVMKYADNILKGLATSAAIVLSSIVSVYLFDFVLSLQFIVGANMVVMAVYLYSK